MLATKIEEKVLSSFKCVWLDNQCRHNSRTQKPGDGETHQQLPEQIKVTIGHQRLNKQMKQD